MNAVLHTYPTLPFCEREILRYAAYRGTPDESIRKLLAESINMVQLSYKVCYQLVPITVSGESCTLGPITLHSHQLAHVLSDCPSAVVFAATIGVGIDRLVTRYSHISPAKALLLQAIGTAQIEELCDTFCADMETMTGLYGKPRFSPGYGDLAIEAQRDFFTLLPCEKYMGLTLNDSLLMSPTKSVTAILGLTTTPPATHGGKCATCPNTTCTYRELS